MERSIYCDQSGEFMDSADALLKVSPSGSDAGIIATDSVSSQEIPQYIANLTTNWRISSIGAMNSDRKF